MSLDLALTEENLFWCCVMESLATTVSDDIHQQDSVCSAVASKVKSVVWNNVDH